MYTARPASIFDLYLYHYNNHKKTKIRHFQFSLVLLLCSILFLCTMIANAFFVVSKNRYAAHHILSLRREKIYYLARGKCTKCMQCMAQNGQNTKDFEWNNDAPKSQFLNERRHRSCICCSTLCRCVCVCECVVHQMLWGQVIKHQIGNALNRAKWHHTNDVGTPVAPYHCSFPIFFITYIWRNQKQRRVTRRKSFSWIIIIIIKLIKCDHGHWTIHNMHTHTDKPTCHSSKKYKGSITPREVPGIRQYS